MSDTTKRLRVQLAEFPTQQTVTVRKGELAALLDIAEAYARLTSVSSQSGESVLAEAKCNAALARLEAL